MTNDPDVPKLLGMLKNLRAGVEAGQFTPEAASEVLGKYADGLVEQRGEVRTRWTKVSLTPAQAAEMRRNGTLRNER